MYALSTSEEMRDNKTHPYFLSAFSLLLLFSPSFPFFLILFLFIFPLFIYFWANICQKGFEIKSPAHRNRILHSNLRR